MNAEAESSKVPSEPSAGRLPPAKRGWWIVWRAVRIVLIAYVGVALVLVGCQSRFVYFPTRELVCTPEAYGLAYEDVSLETSDGVKLHAWLVPAEKPRGAVLICHGNGGNISHRLDTLKIFHDMHLSALIFDYRGYGKSEGSPSEEGTYLDAEAAWRHLTETRGFAPSDVVIFGRSLGGAVAAHLARDYTPGRLVIESAFTSIADRGAEIYWFLPVRWLCRFDYNTLALVREVKCPVLVVHSRDDGMIPFHHGQRIFDAAPEPKTFLEISGSHNDGFLEAGRAYTDALRRFLLPDTPATTPAGADQRP